MRWCGRCCFFRGRFATCETIEKEQEQQEQHHDGKNDPPKGVFSLERRVTIGVDNSAFHCLNFVVFVVYLGTDGLVERRRDMQDISLVKRTMADIVRELALCAVFVNGDIREGDGKGRFPYRIEESESFLPALCKGGVFLIL